MPRRKHRIRKTLASAVLSLSLLLSSCSSKFESPKPIFPKFSPQTSIVETVKRFSMKAESASDYYHIYEKELEKSIEEKKYDFNYAEKMMFINSIVNYDYLSRDRENFNFEKYEKAEDFVKDISGEAFREAFRQFDFVIAFEEDLRNRFYKEENEPEIKSNVRDYFSRVTKASKIDLGASPSIRHKRIHFKTYAKLENVLGFSHLKGEIGTNTLEIKLIKDLNKAWGVLAKYEIDEYEKKESEIVFSLSRKYGENAMLTITTGWGKPLDGNDKKAQETYVGMNYIRLF